MKPKRVLAWSAALLLPVSSVLASGLAHPSAAQLQEVARLIDKHYVRAIPPDSLTAAAQACFEGKLDRYSTYLDSTETLEFQRNIEGRFGGIGIGINADSTTGRFYVPWLLAHSTALQAGVQAGDTLVRVEGVPIRGRELFEVAGLIRGRVGTSVRLVVHRPGTPGELRFTIPRANIATPTVWPLRIADSEPEKYMVDAHSGVAYLRIGNFDKTTATQLDDALEAVDRSGARALVLDLRDNQGGLIRTAAAVADRFLASGTILRQRVRGKPEHSISAQLGKDSRMPMAVLINANTTSAAEILAAALQDHRRAAVIGCVSFGKGVSQELFHLKQASGLLKLTTAIWIRPSGLSIERHIPGIGSGHGGVWPDSGQTVTLAEEEERHWSEVRFETERRMLAANASPDSGQAVPDRVLARAVELLSSAAVQH